MTHIYQYESRVNGARVPAAFGRRATRNSRDSSSMAHLGAIPVLLLALTACSEEQQTTYSCPSRSRTLAATPAVGGAAASSMNCPDAIAAVAGASGVPSAVAGAGGTE